MDQDLKGFKGGAGDARRSISQKAQKHPKITEK
jgi:hypothetical protein